MSRLVYRRIGNRESIVAVHSVNTAAGGGGVRWYEFLIDKARKVTLRQQGTYAPDRFFRWMASPAIDRFGNIGIGYSFGGTPHFAGQRFAARVPSDPPGVLGAARNDSRRRVRRRRRTRCGGRTTRPPRWIRRTTAPSGTSGDYLKKGATTYSTRIGAFRMPGCATLMSGGSRHADAGHPGGDAAASHRLLESRRWTSSGSRRIRSPGAPFGETALIAAVSRRHREIIDVLLRRGREHQPEEPLVGRRLPRARRRLAGAVAGVVPDRARRRPRDPSRGAARRADEVRRMLAEQPDAVHARGGDGHTPLHEARTIEMAELLLSHGADINARDVDHESTPAQCMVRDRQEVARFLVKRGAATRHPAWRRRSATWTHARSCSTPIRSRSAPSCRTSTSRSGISRAGGTIYNWTLGTDKSPHEVAREFGHEDVLQLLMSRTPDDLRLSIACALGDERLVDQMRRSGSASGGDAGLERARQGWRRPRGTTRRRPCALMLQGRVAGGRSRRRKRDPAALGGVPRQRARWSRALLARRRATDGASKGALHNATPLDWAALSAPYMGAQCRTGDYRRGHRGTGVGLQR